MVKRTRVPTHAHAHTHMHMHTHHDGNISGDTREESGTISAIIYDKVLLNYNPIY